MRKSPETNQEVMEMLFPEWNEYALNSLTPMVTEHNNPKHPIVLSLLFISDDDKAQAFQSEPKEGNTEIETTLYIEEHKLGKDLIMQLDFICLDGNPVMKTVIGGDRVIGQSELIKILYKIDNFYLFIADKRGKLLKVKQVEWSQEEYDEVLRQFDFRATLN